MSEDVVVDSVDGVTTLTLNRESKRNALSEALVESLLDSVHAAASDGTRLLVMRGAGTIFSAGFDFTDYESQGDGRLLLRFARIEQLLQAVAHSPVTTMCLVHGATFGAGADLMVACDHRVLDPSAALRMPGYGFGLALGTRRLERTIGRDGARTMLQESRTVGADEALELGLATRLVTRAGWPAAVDEVTATVSTLTPSATRRMKQCITTDTRDSDLADLVRSAAEPGLTARIRAFRTRSERKKT